MSRKLGTGSSTVNEEHEEEARTHNAVRKAHGGQGLLETLLRGGQVGDQQNAGLCTGKAGFEQQREH